MPWEHIGDSGSESSDRRFAGIACDLAVSYLQLVLPEPPEGYEIGVRYHEHDLGTYPTVGVVWEHPSGAPPVDFIDKCAEALRLFNEAVDWNALENATYS